MFIRVLAIWIACGASLFVILNPEPASSPASKTPMHVAVSAPSSAIEPQVILAHLRCVAPVIEGRSLRTFMTPPVSAASRDYVIAPARTDRLAVGACGTTVLAASR